MRASARELLVPFFTPLVWCGRGIRTHDLPLRKRTLYQLSYRGVRNPVLDEILEELRRRFTQHMNSVGQQHIAISTTPSKSTLDSLSW